jgi:hypothetical protein
MAKETELHRAIMSSREISFEEADDLIAEMKERFKEGEDPEEVLLSEGYEPDYVFDILFD